MDEPNGTGSTHEVELVDLTVLDPATAANLPGSMARTGSEFAERVRRRSFPCIFARSAVDQGDVVVGLARGTRHEVLAASTDLLRQLARRICDDDETIGVLFLDVPGLVTIDDDHRLADELLRHWHANDGADWPSHAPRDPADPAWVFWFDGVGFFVNFSSPRHERRHSRNVGPWFTVVAQAREVFDRPDRGGPRARSVIRRRLEEFDDVPAHPALGSFGDEANRESDQFFLGDDTQSHRLWVDPPATRTGDQPSDTTHTERKCPVVHE